MPGPISDVVMADAPMPSVEATAVPPPAVARSDGSGTASEQGTPHLPNGFDLAKTPVIAPPNGIEKDDRQNTISPLKRLQPSSPASASLDTPTIPTPRTLPVNGNAATLIKNDKQALRLNEVIDETSPAVAREVVRKNWRTLIFDGTDRDDHASFILRAGLKNATATVTSRVLKEEGIYKDALVAGLSKKPVIIEAALKQATSEQITNHIPPKILDRVLAQRLTSLPAKDLIRWLAGADRLGYKLDDILEEGESVRPNISNDTDSPMFSQPPTPQYTTPWPQIFAPKKDPLSLEQERNLKVQQQQQQQQQISMQGALLQKQQQEEQRKNGQRPSSGPKLLCNLCNYEFASRSGFHYHTTKRVCQKPGPSDGFKNFCLLCGQGFTTKQGMQYHQIKRVCEESDGPKGSPIDKVSTPPILPPKPPTPRTSTPTPAPGPPPAPSQAQPSISHPPMPTQTPAKATKAIPSIETPLPAGVRVSPNLLSDAQRQKMNDQLAAADTKYYQQIADIPADWSQEQKDAKLISFKNSHGARKSTIRKNFGVSLRLRDRDKNAMRDAGVAAPAGKKGVDKQNRFQEFIARPPRSSPVQGPTSSFSPINAQGGKHQATEILPPSRSQKPAEILPPSHRPNLNITTVPFQPNQNSPSESQSSFSLASCPQQPLSSQFQSNKRPRSRSPPHSSYYNANPPRQSSPFVVQSQAQQGTNSGGLAMQQLNVQDAASMIQAKKDKLNANVQGAGSSPKTATANNSVIAKPDAGVITIDSSSEETDDEEENVRPTPRRMTGGGVDVGPARVEINFPQTSGPSHGIEGGEKEKSNEGEGEGEGKGKGKGKGKGEGNDADESNDTQDEIEGENEDKNEDEDKDEDEDMNDAVEGWSEQRSSGSPMRGENMKEGL